VRRQRTLDFLIERKTQGRQQKPVLQILLRLGLYQIFFLDRVPEHAAVHETVELAKRLGFGPQSGFINAILRGYLRERGETEKLLREVESTNPAIAFSHPDWLWQRWSQRWNPSEATALLKTNNTPPPTFARANTLRGTIDELTRAWQNEGVDFKARQFEWSPLVFELLNHPPLSTLPSFQKGLFYLQDPSTLLAPRELQARAGETVLDLCAAPGGKTTYLAQLTSNQATIVAEDVQPARLALVKENADRLGAKIELDTQAASSVRPSGERYVPSSSLSHPMGEGRGEGKGLKGRPSSSPGQNEVTPWVEAAQTTSPERAIQSQQLFDRILIDAPCSNTGVLRRRVDLRWRLKETDIARLAATQLNLLEQATRRLKPDGTILYSTCSLEPEENQTLIQKFLSSHPEFRLDHERELLPFRDQVDGAYIARLIRST
jgi:16S rRNA (cytosine967-C5)-methyltransferase